MSVQYKYRGRVITPEDISFIQQLMAANPSASRRRLSEKLCEAWQWKQANGALRAMVCRGLLLVLHRAGAIELPPIRFKTPNPFLQRSGSAAHAHRHVADHRHIEGTAARRPATGQANGG